MIIYTVFGETGEYSDYSVWTVVAYLDKAEAQRHMQLAQARADELRACEEKWRYKYMPNNMPNEYKNQYDPEMRMDYTGTNYGVSAIAVISGKADDWATNSQVMTDELREAGELP